MDLVRHTDDVASLAVPSPGGTMNVYAVGPPGGGAVLVDTAVASAAGEVIDALSRGGYRPGDFVAIVITHGHSDHFGGAGQIAAWSGAPVWAHLAAAVQFEDHRGGFIAPGAHNNNLTPAQWQSWLERAGEPVRVARLLRDGETIAAGELSLEVIHAPGHDRGELMLWSPSKRYLFVGDLVQCGVEASGNWLGLYSDLAGQRRSLARARELSPDWLFKGHRRPLRGEAALADLAAAVEHLDLIERALLDSLRQGPPRTLAELTRAAFVAKFGQAPEPLPNYAAVSIAAFLIELSQRGLVQRDEQLNWKLA